MEDKLARLEKHDHRIIRVEVELERERNARQPERQVDADPELTAKSKGPILRAEAAAEDKMAALDLALDKMAAQMRRAADRRKVHRGQHAPESVARRWPAPATEPSSRCRTSEVSEHQVGPVAVDGDGPLVVREKTHPASPITLEQALYEMELVGHDFYLFVDKESETPSVVYRRRGYDYGVISLDLELLSTDEGSHELPPRSARWTCEPICHDSRSAGAEARRGGRVVVVDDQELFRRGLTMLLGVEPDIEVVGEAGDGRRRSSWSLETMPDVVLLDVRMPKRGGLEACTRIKEQVPSARIIMLTVSDEEATCTRR